MSEIPRARPVSPVVAAALEAKTLPTPQELATLTPKEQQVVVAFHRLSNARRVGAPRGKRTLNQ
jgi:hypothetical protein